MKIALNLAGTTIGITFPQEANKVLSVYEFLYADFIASSKRTHASVEINLTPQPMDELPFAVAESDEQVEQVVPNALAARWLGKGELKAEPYPIDTCTISTGLLNGLLLYFPRTLNGRIYLSTRVENPLLPLYQLLWIFFAQVLGERGKCFLHAAALARYAKGFIFIGDSGAGKSTLSRECAGCHVLSDEAPIVEHRGASYRVYPSPFHQMDPVEFAGKHGSLSGAVIQGFYFLFQNEKSFVEAVPKKIALSKIMSRHIHFFHCLSPEARTRLFDFFFEACDRLPVHDLHLCKGEDIWGVLDRERRYSDDKQEE